MTARRLAWAIWLGVVTIFLALSSSALGDGVGPFLGYSVFVLSFATVGALVASRRPGNPIGWILLVAGLAYVAGGVAVREIEDGDLGRWDTLAAWVGAWVWMAGIGPVATFALLLFPDGRLPGPRWRPVAWLAGAGLAAVLAGLALGPFEQPRVENPVALGVPWLTGGLQVLGAAALIASLLAALASLRARYRTAGHTQRQQLKWLLYAGGLIAAAIAVSLPVELIVGEAAVDATNTVATLALATVPAAMGVAILRHRLYDVDLVIRRTLVYGVLTATLAAAYLSCVLLAQLVTGAESDLAIAGSTLAAAALFRPARARIQAGVDRRFYRRRYDAQRTLDAFGARLREQVDLDALGSELGAVAAETMQPAHVSVWLRR